MVLPRHLLDGIKEINANRIAVAPYNFVELPNKVVTITEELLPAQNQYYVDDRYTGKFECTLITESPLYVRCGLSPADFKKFGDKPTSLEELDNLTKEERSRRINFFNNPANLKPMLPGSSLRGMLRSLIEIASFSKLDRVSNNQRLFFRAVANDPNKDSLAAEYKRFVKPDIVKAGYLRQEGDAWYIHPAKHVAGVTFAWVRESSLSLPNLVKFDYDDYRPQYIPVSYSGVNKDNSDRAKRIFAQNVAVPDMYPSKQGILVTSGSMKLTSGTKSPRRNHCLVFEVDSNAKRLRIDSVAIQHYWNALTDFQRETPFSEEAGVLQENRPVFYSAFQGDVVGFFGQSPNFRIPYSSDGTGHASTILNFLPQELRETSVIDIADAVFGYVGKSKQKVREENYAGRVHISDGSLNDENVKFQTIKPKILGSPKTTTFQHYLVQTSTSRVNLKHYASTPEQETVIRGHKLYWRKKDVALNQIRERDLEKLRKGRKQLTEIRLLESGTKFTFNISFESLSKVELGALLWVLSLSNNKAHSLRIGKPNEQYRFSLGMGKPFGMGTVKIDYELKLSDRSKRYKQLFDQGFWNIGERFDTTQDVENCVKAFESFMLASETGICEADHPEGSRAKRLAEIPRIEMLLAMLRCDRTPDAETTRYMTIEKKEYVERPVLPTPLQIMGILDRRRFYEKREEVNQINQERATSKKTLNLGNYHLEQIIDAEVLKKNGIQITYRILVTEQKLTEKEHKKASALVEGQTVKVRIKALKEDGSIKSVKCVE